MVFKFPSLPCCINSVSMERALRSSPGHTSASPIWVPPPSPSGPVRLLPQPKVHIRCCYLESINDQIMAHLEKSISIRSPLLVHEPMRGLTFSAPRSTASALCVAACELLGGHQDRAIPTAAALHIMHAASYVHEHLPLSDGPMSRIEPAIHHEFGPNIELLTGSSMVTFGLELISRLDDDPDLTLRVMTEITRAVGSQGIIHSQYLQVKCNQQGHDECNANWDDSIREKKWDGLHGCAGACGAILGGGSENEIEKLRKYGVYVGILRGMLNESQRGEGWDLKEIEEVKNKAIHELEEINGAKVGPIITLLDYSVPNSGVNIF